MELTLSIIAAVLSLLSIGITVKFSYEYKKINAELKTYREENLQLKSDLNVYTEKLVKLESKQEVKTSYTQQDTSASLNTLTKAAIENPDTIKKLFETLGPYMK